MNTLFAFLGMGIKIAGIIVGVIGLAGVVPAIFFNEPVSWTSVVVLIIGISVASGGLLLLLRSVRRTSGVGKKVFFGVILSLFAGFFLWMGLGVQGILTWLNLDPAGYFKYASPHPFMWVVVMIGLTSAYLAFRVTFSQRHIFVRRGT